MHPVPSAVGHAPALRILILMSAMLVALGFGTVGAALAQVVPRGPSPTFRVGDAVRVTVWGNPDLSGEFDISEDGVVLHPVYRSIRIAGLNLAQAENEFRAVLMRFETDPQFVVEPLFRITVGGEVAAPNVYVFPPYATVAQALMGAGGPTAVANLRRARLLRDGREIRFDVREPTGAAASTTLRSGDILLVDRETRIWRDRIQPALLSVGALSSIVFLYLEISNRI
jgi:protein involved in polysaccharide export with SLBB domain